MPSDATTRRADQNYEYGSALQAIKFACSLGSDDALATFLTAWHEGDSLDPWFEYQQFRTDNPDEPTHVATDGTVRTSHYGAGKQPWDTTIELGMAVDFAGGNVLKYLRRTKTSGEGNDAKAMWYWKRLLEFVNDKTNPARMNDAMRVSMLLVDELSLDERTRLNVPSCFKL